MPSAAHLVPLLGLLLVIGTGCGEDARDAPDQEHPMPRAKPTPDQPSRPAFTPDPAYEHSYGDRPASFAGLFQFDAAVAVPASADADPPEPTPPARWRKAVPLVLEINATGDQFAEVLPLRQVSRVSCFEAPTATAPLVVVDATRDASYSVSSTPSVWQDRGVVTTTVERLRMEFPAALAARLQDRPLDEFTLVGIDAQGRTVLVQAVNGCPAASQVYAGSAVVNVLPDRQYGWMADDGWPTSISIACNAPIGVRDDDSQKAVPKELARKQPLVLDLTCASPLGRMPPLQQLARIYVFADGWRLLQTLTLDACHYRSDAEQTRNFSATKLTEHLRFALTPTIAATKAKDRPWSGHLIGVDGQGRTVVTDSIYGPP